MAMDRVRVIWTGFTGAPGVSTFYVDSGSTMAAAIGEFFTNVSGLLPNDVTIHVENSGDVIDETSGDLTGSWTASSVTDVTGTGGDYYAAPAGMIVDWFTGVVMDRKRLRGRTFLVPISNPQFAIGGGLVSACITGAQDAADALLAADGNLLIWHRPRAAMAADGSRPAVTARAGGYASVSSAHVPNLAAVLRSRRD